MASMRLDLDMRMWSNQCLMRSSQQIKDVILRHSIFSGLRIRDAKVVNRVMSRHATVSGAWNSCMWVAQLGK